jgi:hypothetical protein
VEMWSLVMRAAEGPRSSIRWVISDAVERLWIEILVSRISFVFWGGVDMFGLYGIRWMVVDSKSVITCRKILVVLVS